MNTGQDILVLRYKKESTMFTVPSVLRSRVIFMRLFFRLREKADPA
jgi:hypothetical protein